MMAVAGNIYQLFSFQFQCNYDSLNRSVLIQQTLMNDVTNLSLVRENRCCLRNKKMYQKLNEVFKRT